MAKEKGEKEYRILHWRTFGIEFECPMSKCRPPNELSNPATLCFERFI